jgi:S-DNA-T family DNA segregation ATPase FtsK/SpoIIIE
VAKRWACDIRASVLLEHEGHAHDEGRTDLANLLSLCGFHHSLVHEGGWFVAIVEDAVVWADPDGVPASVEPLRGDADRLVDGQRPIGITPSTIESQMANARLDVQFVVSVLAEHIARQRRRHPGSRHVPRAPTREPREGAPRLTHPAGSVGAIVATKTSSKKRAPAKKSGATRPSKGPSASRQAVGSVLSGHQADIWGVGAILVGLLAAASVWAGAAGVVGEGFDDGLALGLGLLRVVIPIGLVGLGIALIRGDELDESEAERLARVSVGGALIVVALSGLLHVSRGRPGIDDPVSEIGAAGGVLGMAVGGPLHGLLALAGSVLILVAIAIVGVMVLTGSSAREVGGGVAKVVRPAGAMVSRSFRGLFADPNSDVIDLRESTPSPEPEPEASVEPDAPKAKKSRKAKAPAEPVKEQEQQALPVMDPGDWTLPPLAMLARSDKQEVDAAEVAHRGELLHAALAQFGVETTLLQPVVGPTVTRYVLELGEGVKVSKLESLRKDIAYAMASPDVRILAPIPGRRAIGVEVPNSSREIITVGDILGSKEARQASHPLEVAIGRDINGRNMMVNLATMPHVLIAGATGAGKSSCLNSLLTSILMRSTPDQVRLILVDPKRVEMGQYDKAPHLLTAPVTDPRQAANALAWAVREMERRYDLLHKVGFRDITGYNNAVDNGTLEVGLGETDESGEPLKYQRLPFILIVVDELADLMMVAARDVEDSIARIAQMARAVGIHLVIATQRPSVNVITGVIKANVPARLAFAVSSLTDSRVILDQPGAERLVGKGDLLMLGPSSSAPHRVQGCWVEEDEVRAIVKHWRDQAPEFTDDQTVALDTGSGGGAAPAAEQAPLPPTLPGGVTNTPPSLDITAAPPEADDDGDDLLVQAMELVVQTQLGSTSMLQRKLRVGFARAGRIMDLLEEKGVVGPSTGSKARDVLISPEELEARRGEG